MSGKATNDLLEQLHGLIAQDMLHQLKSGNCEAKDWAVIVKFLKDNGIDALAGAKDPAAGDAFAALIEAATAHVSRAAQDLN